MFRIIAVVVALKASRFKENHILEAQTGYGIETVGSIYAPTWFCLCDLKLGGNDSRPVLTIQSIILYCFCASLIALCPFVIRFIMIYIMPIEPDASAK